MRKDEKSQSQETELKKRIKFQPELQHYYQKMHLVLHLQNIWQFIRNYLQEFIRMPEKSGFIYRRNDTSSGSFCGKSVADTCVW